MTDTMWKISQEIHFVDYGAALKKVQDPKDPVVYDQVKYEDSLTGKHTDILVCLPV